MEPLLDKVSRHINLRRFILRSLLITVVGIVVMAVLVVLYEHGLLLGRPDELTPDRLFYGAWFLIDPLGVLYILICDHLGADPFGPVLIILLFSYGPFWALVIELAIKFRSRKRKAG